MSDLINHYISSLPLELKFKILLNLSYENVYFIENDYFLYLFCKEHCNEKKHAIFSWKSNVILNQTLNKDCVHVVSFYASRLYLGQIYSHQISSEFVAYVGNHLHKWLHIFYKKGNCYVEDGCITNYAIFVGDTEFSVSRLLDINILRSVTIDFLRVNFYDNLRIIDFSEHNEYCYISIYKNLPINKIIFQKFNDLIWLLKENQNVVGFLVSMNCYCYWLNMLE
ncbi:hypothetical protein J6590_073590 [Homalodisca vitripennis]|nr:hypothetical protein J6590_073590 [Homalodisca vitripennis]